jgi:hypothetical protein
MGFTRRLFGKRSETVDDSEVCEFRRIYKDGNRSVPYCTCVSGMDFTDLKTQLGKYMKDIKNACLDIDQFSKIKIDEEGRVYAGCAKS